MLFIPYSDIKGEPIICIGTSMIKSFWRMWKREGLTHKDFIKYGKRYFLLYTKRLDDAKTQARKMIKDRARFA